MAEAVFRHMVEEAGRSDDEADLAGPAAGTPGARQWGTRAVLSGTASRTMAARQIDRSDFARLTTSSGWTTTTWPIAAHDAAKQQGGPARFLDFAPDAPVREVPDPGMTGALTTYELVKTAPPG